MNSSLHENCIILDKHPYVLALPYFISLESCFISIFCSQSITSHHITSHHIFTVSLSFFLFSSSYAPGAPIPPSLPLPIPFPNTHTHTRTLTHIKSYLTPLYIMIANTTWTLLASRWTRSPHRIDLLKSVGEHLLSLSAVMRAAVSEAICIDSLLPVLRHLLGMEEVQKSRQESSASSLAMKEVNNAFLLVCTLPLLHMPT